ncbi:hypothetical protein ACOMHN_028522 [Nucella lapillus]
MFSSVSAVNPTTTPNPVTKVTPHLSSHTTGPVVIVTKKVCDDLLGVSQPSVIPRDQLTATTVYDASHEAYKGRLDGPSAWMPSPTTEDVCCIPRFMDTAQWLQVDLARPEQVTGVVTQGHPTRPFWVTRFTLALSQDGADYTPYQQQGAGSPAVFEANTDSKTPVHLHFDREVTARFVRVQPLEWKDSIALRVDVLGCSGQTTTPTAYPPWYTGETPTAYPPGHTGETPTAYPPWYTGETPTAYPPWYTGETPTAYPPWYTGETPTVYPPWYTGETPTAYPPWYTGETPTAYPPWYTGETHTAYPPWYTGETPTAYPPGHTGETPTAYPPWYTGETPTAYPPWYTGETPTAYPPGHTGETPTAYPPWYTGETPTAYPPWYTGETPTAYPPGHTGETPTAYPPWYTGETPTAYPPGHTGETPTAYPPWYTGETPTAYPPGHTGETPTAYLPWYTGETPTAYPPWYTGETPTAYPPGHTGETPTAYPPGHTGETPTAYPPWYTGETPTAYPPGHTGETPTAYPQWYTGETPTAYPPGHTGETPTAYPPWYTGETPTAYPPWYTGETPTAYPPGHTGETPTAYPPWYTGETPTAYPPWYTGETPTAYPPGHTGETPTAYPPWYTGETPTAYPPWYTGETPTAYPPGHTGETPTAYPPWYTGETPTAYPPGHTGETPTAYPPWYTGETPTAYPPGHTGETPTAYPPWYTGETPTVYPPGHTGETPTAYPPWYTGETPTAYPPGHTGETPTAYPPWHTGETPTAYPPWYTGETPTAYPPGHTGDTPTAYPPWYTGETPTAYPPWYTGETPTAYPPGQTGETPTAYPPWYTGETPTAYPPGHTGETPTAYPPWYTGETPTAYPPGHTGETPTAYPPWYTGETPTAYPPWYTGETPTAYPPGHTGETPTAYPPWYTGETPTAYPPWYTGETPTAYPPGHTGETPTAYPPWYTGETPTAYPPGLTGETPTAYPPWYTGETPTAYPPGHTGETPTAYPPWYTGETPTAYPPGQTGETPTAYPPWYTGETPTAYPPGHTGETPTAYPPWYTGETPTAYPPGHTGETPTAYPQWYTGETPTAYPPGYTGETPTAYPPWYTGETPTAYPPWYTGETPTSYPPGHTGETPTAYPPWYTGETPTAYPPWYTGETLTAYPPWYTGETPTAYPPGHTGETPTAYPPWYTGETPTAYPQGHTGETPTAYPLWYTGETPTAYPPGHTGETPTAYPPWYTGETPTAYPPGHTGETPTAYPPWYTGETPTAYPPGQTGETPTAYPPWYTGETPTAYPPGHTGETPTAYPPWYTGETPTAYPPWYTGETPTAYPPGHTGETPTAYPPWYTGETPTAYPAGHTGETPTAYPPGHTGETPTAYPPWYTGETPTAYPPGHTGETPTAYPPWYTEETPTAYPPGHTGETPTAYPPWYTGETPTAYPPWYTGETPTAYPPGHTGETPTAYPPWYTGETPTAYPQGHTGETPTAYPPWYTGETPTAYPPGHTGETPTAYPPWYTGETPTAYPPWYTGETPTAYPPGHTGETPTAYPPWYTGETPTAYPPGHTGETPTAYPPWYTGETPTAYPPGHTGETPTAYPPWYTGETPTAYPPWYTGATPTAYPPGHTGVTPTAYPPWYTGETPTAYPSLYTGETPTAYPPEHTGETPTAYPPWYTGETPTAYPPWYTGETPTAYPPGHTGETPTAYPPWYTGETPTAYPPWYTGETPTAYPPGHTGETPTAYPPWYTGETPTAYPPWYTGETPTAYPPGHTGETPTAYPPWYTGETPTAYPSGHTGETPTAYPPWYTGETPTAYPPWHTGETPTAYPPWYTGETPTAYPPGHTGETPTAYPPGHTGETPTKKPEKLCNVPMTITNAQKFKDSQMTSSSFYRPSTAAYYGRLYNDYSAWVPQQADGNQWLQLDLGRPMEVAGVLTQGSPYEDRWTTAFLLRYSNDSYSFRTYGSGSTPTSLTGSQDRNTVARNPLSAPVTARYWRVVPTSWASAGIALRLNLLGCEVVSTTATTSGSGLTPTAVPTRVPTLEPICVETMGLENYQVITDQQFKASSSLDQIHGASMSRLTPDYSPMYAAWRPAPTDQAPWVQVDFLEPKLLSGILLQGRWPVKFHAQHSMDGVHFEDYIDFPGAQPRIFTASGYGPEPFRQTFNRNIIAQFVRLVPVDVSGDVEVKFNVLGCNPSQPNPEVTTVSPPVIVSETPTAYPPDYTGETPTAYPSWYTGETPTAYPPGHTGETPTAYPPWYTGETPTAYPPGHTGETPTAYPPWYTGETPTAHPPTYTGETPPPVCLVPMGLQSRYIVSPDQMTASSSLSGLYTPDNARVYNQPTGNSGGAWVPGPEREPWIQVNLNTPKLISGVVTQGSPDLTRWASTFTLQYSLDGVNFTPYTEVPGQTSPEVFTGNTDQDTPVRNLFNRNVVSQYLRLYPVTSAPDGFALRFEILGCKPDTPIYIPPDWHGSSPTPFPPDYTGETPTAFPPGYTGQTPTAVLPGYTGETPEHLCNVPMGLTNPEIVSTKQLRASSSLDVYHKPDRARIYTQKDGPYSGGWQPRVNNDKQWIEVDFLTSYAIGGVMTQGSSVSDNWVTKYEVHYSNDGLQFYPVPDTPGGSSTKVFTGNSDRFTPVMHLFHLVHARYIRIRPLDFHGAIALRFNIFGCQSPSATPQPSVSTPTPSASPSLGPQVTPPSGCVYWSPWVNTNQPSGGSEYESVYAMAGLVGMCQPEQVIQLECRVVGTHLPWDVAAQSGVTCDLSQKMLMCLDTPDMTCYDYEIRALCDECPTTPVTSPRTTLTQPPSGTCVNGWSDWYDRDQDVSDGETEALTPTERAALCPGGEVVEAECNSVADNQPYYLNVMLVTTCDVQTGFTCDLLSNTYCDNFKIRYRCQCKGETPTAYPPRHTGETPTAYPPWYTGDTPTAYPPGHTGETPTAYPPWYTGETPTAYPPWYTGETPTAYPPGHTGETPTAYPPWYTGETPTAYPPWYTGETSTAYPPWYTGETPTAYPPGHTGETPTAYPPWYTGKTPTAHPNPCVNGWSQWLNQDSPDSGDGDVEELTAQQKQQLCPGGQLVEIDCQTTSGIEYYSSGEAVTCDLNTGLLCSNADNFPITCQDYQVRYKCKCLEAPTAYPPGYTGITPTAYPPWYTGETPTAYPPGHTGETPTAYPPWYTGETPTAYPPWYTGETPTAYPPWYTGETPTAYPPWYTGETPTAYPPWYTGETPTAYPPWYTGETPTTYPPGHTGETPTAYPPWYTGETPTAYPPWYTKETPTSYPPGHTGETPTAYPPWYTGETPTAHPNPCVNSWSQWLNQDSPDSGDGDVEQLTAQQKQQLCPGGQLVEIDCQTTSGIEYYSSGEAVTCDLNTGLLCSNADNFPITCQDYQVRYKCKCLEAPTAYPPGYTGITPTAYPPWYTGETPTAYPPWYTGETPTAYPPWYTGETPTAYPPWYTGKTPTAYPLWYTGETPTAYPPGHTGETLTAYPPWHTGETPTAYPPGHTGETPTAYPPWYTGETPTAYPPWYTGKTPTAHPNPCVNGWSQWLNQDSPDTGDGDVEQLTAQQKQQLCPGGQLAEIDCQTTSGIEYYSSGEVVTCNLNTGLLCSNADNYPITCQDYQVRYKCETPTAYPPWYTGETPTAYPPWYTGETPTAHPNPCVNGWSQWLNQDSPDSGDGDVEQLTAQHKQQLCPGGQLVEIDCQTTSGIEYYSSGEVVTCDLNTGLLCSNADNYPITCQDYQVRYKCKCLETPTAYPPGYTGITPTAYPPWYTGETPTTYPPGHTGETPTAYPPWYTGETPTAYPPGYTGETPTAYPPGHTGETPTAYPPWYTGETPTAYPPEHTGETPTAYPPWYTGETSTAHPNPCVNGWSQWLNQDSPDSGDGDVEQLTAQQKQQLCPGGQLAEIDCQTTSGIEYYSSGEVVTCNLNTGLLCSNADNYPITCQDYQVRYKCETPTAFPPGHTGETPTAYPPWYTGETPTAYPPWYTGETPTAYPPGHTGETPTAHPNPCVNGWSQWLNQDSPDSGDGDVEQLTAQQKQQLCPGGQLVEIDCQTTSGIEYYSSGEVVTCDLNTGLLCSNADNYPITCQDYQVRYKCKCLETPTAYPPGYTGITPTAYPPWYTGETPTAYPPGHTGETPTAYPPWYTGETPTAYPQGYTGETPTAYPPWYTGETPTAYPPWYTGETPTAYPPEHTGETPTAYPPGHTGETPTAYPPEHTGETPTAYPPWYTGETPTAHPNPCVNRWSQWLNQDSPDSGDGDVEQLTAQQKQQLCPGGQLVEIDCQTTSGIEYYSSGEVVTCDLNTGLLCSNTDNFPITCQDYQVRYKCKCLETPTAYPPGYTGITPTAYPPGYTGKTPTAYPPWYTGETPTAYPLWYTGETFTAYPPGHTGETPTAYPPWYTGETPTAHPNTCVNGWSQWLNQDSPDSGDGDVEQLTAQQKQQLCPGGQLVVIDCQTTSGIEYYSSGEVVTCDLNTGLLCSNADNFPITCQDYQVRYKCKCLESPTAYPPGYTGITPTAYPPWYTGETPTAYPPGHTGETPTAYPPWYTGETPTAYPPGHTGKTPTAYPPWYTGDTPTAYPPWHTGATPTASKTPIPGVCVPGWSAWINRDHPDIGDGDMEKITDSELAAFCSGGGQLVKIECSKKDGTPYYSSGEVVTCDLRQGSVCKNVDNFPIPCSDFMVRYMCDCSHASTTAVPALTTSSMPPSVTTQTASLPCTSGWSQWLNQDSPDSGDGDVEQLTAQQKQQLCPGGQLVEIDCQTTSGIEYYSSGEVVTCDLNTGLLCSNADNFPITCQDYQVRFKCKCLETPTAYPPGYTGITPTAYPPWYTGETPTAYPPGQTGETPTAYPPWYTGETPTAYPPGHTGETPTAYPPWYTGETPTAYPPGHTGETPTAYPPWYTGDTPTAYPPWHTGATPTASKTPIPGVCVPGWSAWINRDHPDIGDGDMEKITDSELAAFCSGGGQLVKIECSKKDGTPYYSSGEVVTCDLRQGSVCKNVDNFPIPCSDFMVRYMCDCSHASTTAVPALTTSSMPPSVTTQTASLPCTSGWSQWLNQDSPDSGDEDVEQLTAQQKQQLCPGGQLVEVDCQTTSGIEYYSSGEVVTCDLNTGLLCSNADNFPITCQDYQVRFKCKCLETPTAYPPGYTGITPTAYPPWYTGETPTAYPPGQTGETPTAYPPWYTGETPTAYPPGHTGETPTAYPPWYTGETPTAYPPGHTGETPTAYPPWYTGDTPTAYPPWHTGATPTASKTPIPGVCVPGWSAWINRDHPDIGDGDMEKITDSELAAFCSGGGQLVKIECSKKDGTPYYSSGEVVTCDLRQGSVCKNVDNFPIPCSDFMVRYMCDCSHASTTAVPALTTSSMPPSVTTQTASLPCTSGWSQWLNQDSPDSGDEDVEQLTAQHKQQLCPGGQLVEIDCQTTSGIEYYSSGEVVTCDLNTGLLCSNADNFPITCQDYQVRYKCKCLETPTAYPPGYTGITPTAYPPGYNGETPTAYPPWYTGETPTAFPPWYTGETPTAYPPWYTPDHTTAYPPLNTGEAPTAQPNICVNGWSQWLNQDSPDSGDGDVEQLTAQQKQQLCPGGQLVEIDCQTTSGIESYSSGEVVTCDLNTGLLCSNADNFPITCQDYQVRYKCKCREGPHVTPSSHPSMTSYAHSTSPSPSTVITTCSKSFWTPWINKDIPSTGDGDHEALTDVEKAAMCVGGRITDIQCYTTGDIPSYSSGEILTCDLASGLVCSTIDNYPIPCSDYQIRYFCQCDDVTTVSPTFHTRVPQQPVAVQCAWSPWLNADSPSSSPGDLGDLETIDLLKQTFGLCPNIIDIECRVADGNVSWAVSGQQVTCDAHNGLRCYNREQSPTACLDYEVRVLCWSPVCSGKPPSLRTTLAPHLPHEKTTQSCVAGESWHSCVSTCDELCDYAAQSSGQCDGANPAGCLPGCTPLAHRPACQPGEKRLDDSTCVPQQMCPCMKPDGTKAMPYETWKNPADSCSDCSCQNGYPLCTNHDPTCTPGTPSTPATGVTPEQPCGWSQWMNTDGPVTGSGDIESLAALRPLFHLCDAPLRAECRDVTTHQPAPASVTCDVSKGLTCLNVDHQGKCADYEIRVYCPCTNSTTTQSKCVSGWSHWINRNSPAVSGTGDVEKMTSSELTSFCPGGTISQVDCRTVDGIEYFSSGEILTCTTDGGLQCNNADNFPIPCSDYKIKYQCTCPGGNEGKIPNVPVKATTRAPPGSSSENTTPAPTQPCVDGWSAWINKDSPDTGDGDHEHMTSSELTSLCPGGTISQVDCRTVDGIEYFSSGEILTCTTDGGLQCNNADNMPIPCSDYKIKYLCTCPVTTPTASPSPTTIKLAPTTTTAAAACQSGWSAWINRDHPDVGQGDHEQMTSAELAAFCPGGTISKINCLTVDSIEYYSGGEILTCTTDGGLQCNNADNFPIPCSDYKIQYQCTCHGGNEGKIPNVPVKATTRAPPGSSSENTTPAPTQPCVGGWSAWINKDSPDTGDGDHEHMTSSELTSLCPGGTISQVDCRTVDGIEYFSSGEILTCTTDGGLQCNNADNLPIPCSDYKIKYLCTCPPIVLNDEEPTATPTPAPRCGWTPWLNGHQPSAQGEMETITALRKGAHFCASHDITALECQPVNGQVLSPQVQAAVTCDLRYDGVVCRHEDLPAEMTCPDYQVRFLCEPRGQNCPDLPTVAPQQRPLVTPTHPSHVPDTCLADMGMANGQIRDDMIYASSSRDASHSPQRARLNGHSCWLAARDDSHQFIQVDLLTLHYVTGVTTQGRDDAPLYVSTYRFLYSMDGVEWNVYREETSVDKILTGNSDSVTSVQNLFAQPIKARYVRINPVTWQGRIAMRFELQGCFEAYPTDVIPTVVPTARPDATPVLVPSELEGCVEWGQWLDLHQPNLSVRDDVTPLRMLQAASPRCADPVWIQCRTATPDHTPWQFSGQPVRCNLWDGLVCRAEDVEGPACYNYESRLGCLKQTPQCLTQTPTAVPTAGPSGHPVAACYPGLDVRRCPASCGAGQLCDGLRCVARSDCPCSLHGKVVRARDVTTNERCETCQCLNGEIRCVAKNCPDCSQGLSHLNGSTCSCQCLTCKANEFQCSTGSCIPQSSRCDGVIDCQNDELECVKQGIFHVPTAVPTPEPNARPGHRALVTTPPDQVTTVRPVCRYTHDVRPGESWSDGVCKTCGCMLRGDGSVSVSCQQQRCPPCQIGEKRVLGGDECCGQCRPVGCVVNGSLYQDGEVIPGGNSCYRKTCVRDSHFEGVYFVKETQRQCPSIERLLPCLHVSRSPHNSL